MKKGTKLLICIMLILFLPILASAHPGRTDGNGGHTNRSTGEYHYHHGYSAHDHYDMDGDGDVDCPYDFKDKTGSNSGSTSSNKSTSSSSNQTITSTSASKSSTSNQAKRGETKMPTFMYWVIGILAFIILCLCLVIRGKNETIDRNEQAYRRWQKEEEVKVKEGLTNLHNALVAKYGNDYLYAISGAPDGDYIGEDMCPHSSGALRGNGLDSYTFYLGGPPRSAVKYHRYGCRYARSNYPVNVMHLRGYTACYLCNCRLPDTSWVDRYNKHYDFLKKYIVIKRQTSSQLSYPKAEPGDRICYREQ